MTISQSPLAPHVECGAADGWLRSLAVRPKAVKVFGPGPARDVKAVDSRIVTVLRRYVADQDSYLREGAAGGRRFVAEQRDLDGVDIFEGLNECTGWGDPAVLAQASAFHLGFVEACAARGVVPCVLNIAVGNPDPALVHLLAPCVQAAGAAGGYVGYHGYGPARILDAAEYYALRGPRMLEPALRAAGVTAPIRWLYTEAGFDVIGSHPGPSGAWRSLITRGFLTIEQVQAQYDEYAKAVQAAGIAHAFLFTFWGSGAWQAYDHAADPRMLAWYARHLETFAAPAPTPAPAPAAYPYRARVLTSATPHVHLRISPAATAAEIGELHPGTLVVVTGPAGEWAPVTAAAEQAGGGCVVARGYVMARYLERAA